MERSESICMSEYSYKDNLIYTSKESEVYKAVNKNHPNSMPYIFKGYPESYLTDTQKERKLMQELNTLWKLHGKENILQIITQHSRDKKVFIITEFCDSGTLAQ
jgi:serine/threonine protein kinase